MIKPLNDIKIAEMQLYLFLDYLFFQKIIFFMIINAIQKGGLIYIYTDKGMKTRNGYLVSFTGSSISFVSSPGSQLVIVLDEKLYRIRSFNAPHKITSGPGWSK